MDQLFAILLDSTKPDYVREQAASDLLAISDGLGTRTNEKAAEVQKMTEEIHTVSCLSVSCFGDNLGVLREFRFQTEADGIQVETLSENVSDLGVTSDAKIESLRQQVEYKKQEVKRANDEYLEYLKKAQETAAYGESCCLGSDYMRIYRVLFQSGSLSSAGSLVPSLLVTQVCHCLSWQYSHRH
jgi:hypothetical protein